MPDALRHCWRGRLLAEGRVDEAEPVADASEALAGQDLKTSIAWRVAKAEVLAARGDASSAVALAEEAVEIAAATDLVIDHADACVALAGLRDGAGDGPGARSARADAVRLYDLKGATVPAQRLAGVESAAPSQHLTPRPVAASGADEGSQRLAQDGRTARAENLATRWGDELIALTAAGRWEEAGAMFADEHTSTDHRATVVVPPTQGPGAYVALLRSFHEVGMTIMSLKHLATRGDLLTLFRGTAASPGGDEVLALGVTEVRPDGRCTVTQWYDDDDLDAAQADLDARYLAGEGAPHARLLEIARAAHEADRDADFDTLRGLLAEDFVMDDHRRLVGMGTGDGTYLVEASRVRDELAPSRTILTRVIHLGRNAVLAVQESRRLDAQGGEYLWAGSVLMVIDASDLITRLEWHDIEDFDTALAHLDELGAADLRHPGAENAGTLASRRFLALVAARQLDEAAALVRADHVQDDFRKTVPNAQLHGRDEFMASLQATLDVGLTNITLDPIAVRGERLHLSRACFRTDDGNEIPMLSLAEFDADGLGTYLAFFEDDALDDAAAALEARYLAGEGRPHAPRPSRRACCQHGRERR